MPQNTEIVLEGSYLYFNNEVNYSQENFKLVNLKDTSHLHLYSEILSRIETGEFLKILVRYEMNSQYLAQKVKIEKTLGNKFATEFYELDHLGGELRYTFQNSSGTQEFKRSFNTRHSIATPAFSSSALFILSRRIDPSIRTPVTLISSENHWTYEGPPKEKVIYIEVKTKDKKEFILEALPVDSSLYHLYEVPLRDVDQEKPVELILSKDYSIPYQMTFGDQKIVTQKFKKKDQTSK